MSACGHFHSRRRPETKTRGPLYHYAGRFKTFHAGRYAEGAEEEKPRVEIDPRYLIEDGIQAMEIKTILTQNAPAPGGTTRSRRARRPRLRLRQLAIDPRRAAKARLNQEQTEQVLRNVAAILEAADSD